MEDIRHLANSIRAEGDRVTFSNVFMTFGDDGEPPPREVLARCQPIRGNYGQVASAAEVADMVASALRAALAGTARKSPRRTGRPARRSRPG
jgi:hypothetical protein